MLFEDERLPGGSLKLEVLARHASADLGDAVRARALLEHAIALLERQAPSRQLVRSYRRLADLLRAQGDTEAALAILDRVKDPEFSGGSTEPGALRSL